jgi:hypothetical protein
VTALGQTGVAARRSTRWPGLHWVALATVVAAEVALVGLTLHVLVDWPAELLHVATAATVTLIVGLLLGTSARVAGYGDRLLLRAIPLVGLTALVLATFLGVVVGLGRPPTGEERTLLLLSIVAAAVCAAFAAPARRRLDGFATRLVYGERTAPRSVIRRFADRLSRAVPLEELLLQMAEALRASLALESAEIWTGAEGAASSESSRSRTGARRLCG